MSPDLATSSGGRPSFLVRRGGLLVFALGFALYLNVLPNDFVWDDHHFVLARPEIRSLHDLGRFFIHDVRGLYRPLREVFYALFWRLFGPRPFGWHWIGPLAHGLTSLSFYAVAAHAAGRRTALLAGILFAAHSVHTERVSAVTGSMDLLSLLFMTSAFAVALGAGLDGTGRMAPGRSAAVLALFAAALFCGEEAVLLPAYLVAYLAWRGWEQGRPLLRERASFILAVFLVAATYLGTRLAVLTSVGRGGSYPLGSFGATVWTMGQVLLRYAGLLVLPVSLRTEYTIPPAAPFTGPGGYLGWGLFLALALAAAILTRRGRLAGFALAWTLFALLPFLNLLPATELIAERYLYVPSMGYCLLVGGAVARLTLPGSRLDPRERRALLALFAVLVVSLAVQTVARNRIYRNDCTLFADTVEKTPTSSHAQNNMGVCLARLGRTAEAEARFALALRYNAANERALWNLALSRIARGDIEAARRELDAAVADGTAGAGVRFLMGLAHGLCGDEDVPVIVREDGEYLVGRGVAAIERGHDRDSRRFFREALAVGNLDAPYRALAEAALLGKTGERDLVQRILRPQTQ